MLFLTQKGNSRWDLNEELASGFSIRCRRQTPHPLLASWGPNRCKVSAHGLFSLGPHSLCLRGMTEQFRQVLVGEIQSVL